MPRIWMQVAVAFATVMLVAPSAQAKPTLVRQIDAYVAPMVATRNFSGVVLVARGDKVLVRRAYGLASQELGAPNTVDGKFQLASASKPLTAAAVQRLVEQGKLELDGPIARLLPDYPNAANITVRQLLTHTAGLPNVNQMPIYRELGLKRRTPAEIVDAFKAAKVSFAPGAAEAYSNSNYALLALLIEKASGKSYGEAMQAEVFGPLRMTASGHRDDQTAILPGMTSGYDGRGRTDLARPAWFDWTVKTGNGSLYSTADDLLRFMRGYFGGELVGTEMLRAATTPRAPTSTAGFGWRIGRHLDRIRYQHGGSSPGYSTQISYYPDDQLTVVVLSNIYVPTAQPTADAVAAMALGKPHRPALVGDVAVAPGAAARVVGVYAFGADFLVPKMKATVVREDGRLWMKADTPFFRPTPLFPQDDLNYTDRNTWSQVAFEAAPGAEATALTFSGQDPLGGGMMSWRAVREP